MEELTGGDLKKYERETVITFNELEKEALIYTSNRGILTKCNKAGYELVREDKFSKQFKCPKRCISFRNVNKKPRKPMSDKQKEILMKNRAKKA